MVTGPLDPFPEARSRPIIHKLAVKQRIKRKIAVPLQPPLGPNGVSDVRLENDRPGVELPRPPEVRLRGVNAGGAEVGVGGDVAELEGEAGGLVGVLAALGRDGVLLVGEALAGEDLAVLEDGSGVAEDEVDGATDLALAEELAHGVGVQGVLVGPKAAAEEDGEVGVGAERHRLVLLRPRRVLDR